MSDKRFEHRPFSQCIKDNQTGYLHSDLEEIATLLNEMCKCETVMRKYGIDNVEKLDQVLLNQRVW